MGRGTVQLGQGCRLEGEKAMGKSPCQDRRSRLVKVWAGEGSIAQVQLRGSGYGTSRESLLWGQQGIKPLMQSHQVTNPRHFYQ